MWSERIRQYDWDNLKSKERELSNKIIDNDKINKHLHLNNGVYSYFIVYVLLLITIILQDTLWPLNSSDTFELNLSYGGEHILPLYKYLRVDLVCIWCE